MGRISIFFNGLHGQTKFIANNSNGGSFMKKIVDEAFTLLKELASNSYN